MKRRVVVTGLGAISPLGLTVPELWKGLLEGRSGVGKITKFDVNNPPETPGIQPKVFPTRIAAEIKNFDPLNYMEVKEAKRIDLHHQYILAAAKEAYEDSGLSR